MDLSFVPEHLRPFIAKQDASLYTPMDHASWRYVLRVSQSYLSTSAHPLYINGLQETGISTDRIPLIEEMDAKLSRFGWRAVAVSGFIPPAVFLEFQGLGILPIACEMRTLEHLAYTPAPDIVHEAAGHAPIIADPEFAQYLRNYGEVARRVIFSAQDMALYEAVRNLSIVKEDPQSTAEAIDVAQKLLDSASADVTYASEATQLGRLGWWTTEYGLIGPLENPRIYGAGLLSSVGESYACLKPEIRRLPLTLDCVNTNFDITKPQPQLFVTPDFKHLTKVLNEFAATLAFRKGGGEGLAKAQASSTVCTVVLDTGAQISGVITAFRVNASGEVTFVKTTGPTQISQADLEIRNQGPEHHPEGFSSPIGPLVDGRALAELTDPELQALRPLVFASGITVDGELTKIHRELGQNLILTYTNCTVKNPSDNGDEILFQPDWGTFDLVVGQKVTSVFGGAADRVAYLKKTGGYPQTPMVPKCNLTPENRELNTWYAELRRLRDTKVPNETLLNGLSDLEAKLEKHHSSDWLLRLEILEVLRERKLPASTMEERLRARLAEIATSASDKNEMIQRGLELIC